MIIFSDRKSFKSLCFLKINVYKEFNCLSNTKREVNKKNLLNIWINKFLTEYFCKKMQAPFFDITIINLSFNLFLEKLREKIEEVF